MHRTLLALVLFVPAVAEADVPPPPGYVESCAARIQTRAGKQCRDCNTYHGNPPSFCADQMGAGFEIVCRSRGASAWNEVWCRDTPAGETAEQPDAPSTTETPTPTPDPAPAPAAATPAPATTSTRREGCSSNLPASSVLLPLSVLALMLATRRARVG